MTNVTTNIEAWKFLRILWELDELYDIGDGQDGAWFYMSIRDQAIAIEEMLLWWESLQQQVKQE